LPDHQAPVAAGGCTPKPRKLRTAPSSTANTTRRLASNHQHRPDIGQQFPRQHVDETLAAGACRLDEFAAHQIERDTARHAAIGATAKTPIAIAVFIRLGGHRQITAPA